MAAMDLDERYEVHEKDDSAVHNVQLNMEMSRGMQPELTFNFGEVEDLKVFDETGKTIRFGDIYKDQKTIIVFVRHFLCFMCKEYVDDLALVREDDLKDANAKLVVIGCGPWKFIKPFRNTTGYKHALYVDPERHIYKRLGLLEKMKIGKKKDSIHIKSNFLTGIVRSTWRGMTYCEFQGDVNQQGGSFVLGPGKEIHFCHADETTADHAPINDLLMAAGVSPVNYPGDQRVLHL